VKNPKFAQRGILEEKKHTEKGSGPDVGGRTKPTAGAKKKTSEKKEGRDKPITLHLGQKKRFNLGKGRISRS